MGTVLFAEIRTVPKRVLPNSVAPFRPTKKDRSYFMTLEKKAEELAAKNGCRFIDNETPYERVEQGHPTIVDYFYHEEVRGTENSGRRNK